MDGGQKGDFLCFEQTLSCKQHMLICLFCLFQRLGRFLKFIFLYGFRRKSPKLRDRSTSPVVQFRPISPSPASGSDPEDGEEEMGKVREAEIKSTGSIKDRYMRASGLLCFG